MTAFTQGMQLGMKAWNDAEAAKRQKVLDDRATEEYNRKKSLWQEEDAAFANLNTVQSGVSPETQQQIKATYGMTPQQIAQAGGAEGLKQKLASYDVPDSSDLQSVPATGLQPRFDASQLKTIAPSELDVERALRRVAVAQRNTAAIRDSYNNETKLLGKQEMRDFTKKTMGLFNARNESPEAMAAWQEHVSPFTKMATSYSGLDMDVRVNPKTGKLESVPYSGGKVGELDVTQVMPYLMQSHQLSSQYGDPVAAAEALSRMSAEERRRVMENTSFRYGIADKESQAVHRANTDANQAAELGIKRITAGAQADYYRNRGAVEKMGAAQYFTGEDGNTYAAIPTMGKGGLTFQTVKVNPEDVKLAKVNGTGGKPAKAEEVDEAGKLYKVPQPNGGSLVMKTDGMGGYVAKDAPLPSERAKFLVKNGVPDDVANTISANNWGQHGDEIIFGGKAYGLGKGDLKALTKAVRENRSDTAAAADSAKALQGFRRSEIEARNGPGRNQWVPSLGGIVNSNTGLVRADPNLLPDFTDPYATGALPRGLLINR